MPAAARQDMESILDASWMDGAKAFRVIVKPCSKTFSSLVLRHGSLLGLRTTMMTRPRFFFFLALGQLALIIWRHGSSLATITTTTTARPCFLSSLTLGQLAFQYRSFGGTRVYWLRLLWHWRQGHFFLTCLAIVLDLNFVEFKGVVPVKPAFFLKLGSHGKFLRLNPKTAGQ